MSFDFSTVSPMTVKFFVFLVNAAHDYIKCPDTLIVVNIFFTNSTKSGHSDQGFVSVASACIHSPFNKVTKITIIHFYDPREEGFFVSIKT